MFPSPRVLESLSIHSEKSLNHVGGQENMYLLRTATYHTLNLQISPKKYEYAYTARPQASASLPQRRKRTG